MARLTIAVDGPASSGKGTVARLVAQALDYQYIDTGAMFRSVALTARRRGVAWDDGLAVAAVALALAFEFHWSGGELRVWVDGEDVSAAIRTEDIGKGASDVGTHPPVREALLGLQRRLAAAGGVVMDGRDIGTVVLPDADLKIFLDASIQERARRRHLELAARGVSTSLGALEAEISERDFQDSNRAVAPLAQAHDAVYVDTTEVDAIAAAERVVGLAVDRGAAVEG